MNTLQTGKQSFNWKSSEREGIGIHSGPDGKSSLIGILFVYLSFKKIDYVKN